MYKPTKSNSMAGYIKQEMKDLNESGKNPTCYRMKRRGQVSNQELARILTRGGSGLAQGDVMHVLIALSEVFPTLLTDATALPSTASARSMPASAWPTTSAQMQATTRVQKRSTTTDRNATHRAWR